QDTGLHREIGALVEAGVARVGTAADGRRRQGAVDVRVVHDGEADLLEVVDAMRAACGLARRLHGRQQQGDQDGDDRDDDEELDQGETATTGTIHGRLTPVRTWEIGDRAHS